MARGRNKKTSNYNLDFNFISMDTLTQLVCSLCDRRYNMDTRQPYIIKCCLETACKECVTTKMIPLTDQEKADKLNDSLDEEKKQEASLEKDASPEKDKKEQKDGEKPEDKKDGDAKEESKEKDSKEENKQGEAKVEEKKEGEQKDEKTVEQSETDKLLEEYSTKETVKDSTKDEIKLEEEKKEEPKPEEEKKEEAKPEEAKKEVKPAENSDQPPVDALKEEGAHETTMIIDSSKLEDRLPTEEDIPPFECRFCQEKSFPGHGVNKAMLSMLEKALDSQKLIVNCDAHPTEAAEYFNRQSQRLVCQKCVIEEHKDSLLECTPIDNSKMRVEIESAFERLIAHREKVNIVVDDVEKLLEHEQALKSSDFMNLLNAMDEVLPKPKSPEELAAQTFPHFSLSTIQRDGSYTDEEVRIIREQQAKAQEDLIAQVVQEQQQTILASVQPAAVSLPLTPPVVYPPCENLTLSEPSMIEEVNMNLPLLYTWLMRKDKLHFTLLYRGTQHGFTLPALHAALDTRGPLLFLVKSATHNQVFGGYTSKPWSTPPPDMDSKFHYDHNAFIFSLSKKSKHLPFQNEYNAVQHFNKNALFAFGWGDFGVQENCDVREDSWSNYGCTKWTKYTYKLPRHLNEDSDLAYKYLAGAHKFRVQEIEVYEVGKMKSEEEMQQEEIERQMREDVAGKQAKAEEAQI
ncbi:hypothetical protein FGO68_gene17685 [Halteria grandinella]|uniref:TLDc domain-containing protein n=1 Tax=Halteria grandinella TaxID=5974 RepID=A0A8J8NWV7_HALGN|nr:hypothetical protein FGO68_gene17685 [Halteria grandinella]